MSEPRLADRLDAVQERIRLAAEKCQRQPDEILLLAVSKTKPADAVRTLHAAGCRHFGENYVQEALDKQSQLQDLDLQWHYIGPIQSNKTRALATHFSWVQSVDRSKIARRLSEQRPPELGPLNICLQVNIDNEPNKSGVAPDDVPRLCEEVSRYPNLQLRGLMAIPRPRIDPDEQFACFRQLSDILGELERVHPEMDTLSMGMSADLEAAIEAGATIVRIGTDLFGPR